MRRLFLTATLVLVVLTAAICDEINFNKIRVNDNPYVGSILCVFQDSKGYIWIGSINGLVKYDGKNLQFFNHSEEDTGSISDDYIVSIGEDSKGNIWVGTNYKLNKYLPISGSFQKYDLNLNKSNLFIGNNLIVLNQDSKGRMWFEVQGILFIYDPEKDAFSQLQVSNKKENLNISNVLSVYEDFEGIFWIGTSDGLLIYNPKSNELKKHKFVPHQNTTLTENFVNVISADSKNNIWLGTFGGIIIYERETKKFIQYFHNILETNSLSNDQITGIVFTDNDKAWICTNYGLNVGTYDSIKRKYNFKLYTAIASEYNSISSDILTSIIKDTDGRLWISSRFGGIDIIDPNDKKFEHFAHIPDELNSMGQNNVTSFAEDNSGFLWISTDGGGINKMNLSNNTFTRYKLDKNDPNSISGNKTLALLVDDENKLWIGYWEAGLDRYDLKTKKMDRYRYNVKDSNTISSDYIFYLMQDSKKNIWICHWGSGITLYNPKLKQFIRYPKKSQGYGEIKTTTITIAYEDSHGIIWFGTENNGLYSFNYETDTFKHYTNPDTANESLNYLTVNCICEDSKGRLWVGTRGAGLILFNPIKETFKQFSKSDGLPDDIICGILEDDEANLWISTTNGISKVKIDDTEMSLFYKNYDQYDGLNGNIFNRWAFYKSKTNEFYFGGIHGFNRFYPLQIKDNSRQPEVRLTNIYLLDKKLTIDNKEVNLNKPIDELQELTLSNKNSKITFEFTALNYTQPFKNQFSYYLEGFDEEWHYNGNYNKAVFTNLDPGSYIFRVKASNNDDVWNEDGISLKITITPPYWQTFWFRILIGLLIALIIAAFFRLRLKKYREEIEKQREVALILRKAKEKAEESDKFKSSVIANFSHEIRTPINGILGFTDILARSNLDDVKRERYVSIVKSRYNNLIKIMDSILFISNLVSGGIELNEKRFALKQLIISINVEFNKLIEEFKKTLKLEIKYTEETFSLIMVADYEKIYTVLLNLVDNAIKFSSKGTIIIKVEEDINSKMKFAVSDEGIGIDDSNKELVFEMFRQVENGTSRLYGGMGIGLPLCRNLLQLLGGEIWFESKLGEGSTFYFTFPYKKE